MCVGPSHQRIPASKGGQRPAVAQRFGQDHNNRPVCSTHMYNNSNVYRLFQGRGGSNNRTADGGGVKLRSKASFSQGQQPALHNKGASHKAKRDSSNADYSKADFMKTPGGPV